MEGVKEEHNDIPKSFQDDRVYRGLLLHNDMKVLLISDPTTEKGAAAMDVHIGKLFKISLLKFLYFKGQIRMSSVNYHFLFTYVICVYFQLVDCL